MKERQSCEESSCKYLKVTKKKLNKRKVFNDPVYGFINIPSDLIFDIIEHPFFQRLRRIRQMGLADFVYPGALHTRFHHALGAMHLMQNTLNSLRTKGQDISDDEFEATLIAILLHDIGHGPFSHALEYVLLPGVGHEQMSQLLIRSLCKTIGGNTHLAYQIFTDQYERRFLHQLVSSQLDIDRLDYLKRDCFYTGVSEGEIGADRIIKMLDVRNDEIVVEEKGIYSIENFLNARRLMYWQVYLHKASVSAEKMMISTVQRAIDLAKNGVDLSASPALVFFLKQQISLEALENNPEYLQKFTELDDVDVWSAMKQWKYHTDGVLSSLSQRILERKLFRIRISNEPFSEGTILEMGEQVRHCLNISKKELNYFMIYGNISNAAYISEGQKINIITKQGKIFDIAKASDLPNIKAMSKIVTKYYLCWPKDVILHEGSLAYS